MAFAKITATAFVNLINRLGLRPPPAGGWFFSDTVVPVSVVDADIVIPASLTTILLDISASAGEQAAPAGGTVLADTGQLAAGQYQVLITIGQSIVVAGSSDFVFQRRNAANNANVWRQVMSLNTGGQIADFFSFYGRLLLNERFRVITENPTISTVESNIWTQLIVAG